MTISQSAMEVVIQNDKRVHQRSSLPRRSLRALIVTACPPPEPGRDVHGIYRRLGMFVGALGEISETLEILHFTAADAPPPSSFMNANQSAHWGTPVQVSTVRQRTPPREWWRYLAALFTIRARPRYSIYGGHQQLEALKACLDRKPDIIFVHRLAGMVPFFELHGTLPPTFFDLDDVEHRVKLRSAWMAGSNFSKLSNLMQVPALYWAERKAAKQSCRTFLCSEEDRRYLDRLGVTEGVTTIPNAVAMPSVNPAIPQTATILFLGGYHYEPNAQAAQRLITRIWPLISRRIPEARLIIAGASPERIPSFHTSPEDVEFTGFVDDLAALYARTRLVCSPIDAGGGTRVKLIEAAAWGRPIVSSSIGAEGLSFENGAEILIRDDDEGIAAECIRLLRDHQLGAKIGEAARQRAASTYELGAVRLLIKNNLISGLGRYESEHALSS